jgi:hypothetical protein
MPLNNIVPLEDVLRSITRNKHETTDEFEKLKVIEERENRTATGKYFTSPAVYLYLLSKDRFTSKSLISVLDSELKKNNHQSNEEIIKAILLLFSYHPQQKDSPLKSLVDILSFMSTSVVSLYYVLPGTTKGDFKGVAFGNFELKIIDHGELKYKCECAKSDYFDLYKSSIIAAPSITQHPYNVKIINWHSFLAKKYFLIQDDIKTAVLNYFEALSKLLFEDFWAQFNEQQNLHIACGLTVIGDNVFKNLRFSQSIVVFNRIFVKEQEAGYVVPVQFAGLNMTIGIELGDEIKNFYEKVKTEFHFNTFQENEIHSSLKTFIRFVAKGARFIEEQRHDEGFLHYVIALDLLFGDKGESTKSVGNRCAVLTFGKMKGNFKEQKSLVDDIYSTRSKYVHAGKTINYTLVDSVKQICKLICLSLLKIQTNERFKHEGGFENWKRKLDFVANGLIAQIDIPSNIMYEIGIYD